MFKTHIEIKLHIARENECIHGGDRGVIEKILSGIEIYYLILIANKFQGNSALRNVLTGTKLKMKF